MYSTYGTAPGKGPAKPNFSDCAALHFDPDPQSRQRVTAALQGMRFGRIERVESYETLCEAVNGGTFDLMVSDTAPEDGDVCELVRSIRHSTVGRDPFPAIIMLTANPVADLVHRAIDAGPDHLVKWPFSYEQIAKRIDAIVDARKPFVVTFNYIGPDRRSDPGRSSGTMLFKVPNALRAKAKKDLTALPTPQAIEATVAKINLHRIGCCHASIATSVRRLREAYQTGVSHAERADELVVLRLTIDDLKQRVAGTDHAESAALCAAMASVVERLQKAADNATDKDFDLLEQTGMALHLSFERASGGGVSADVSSTAALITGKSG